MQEDKVDLGSLLWPEMTTAAIEKGTKVYHNIFGTGTVVEVDSSGEKAKIEFKDEGDTYIKEMDVKDKMLTIAKTNTVMSKATGIKYEKDEDPDEAQKEHEKELKGIWGDTTDLQPDDVVDPDWDELLHKDIYIREANYFFNNFALELKEKLKPTKEERRSLGIFLVDEVSEIPSLSEAFGEFGGILDVITSMEILKEHLENYLDAFDKPWYVKNVKEILKKMRGLFIEDEIYIYLPRVAKIKDVDADRVLAYLLYIKKKIGDRRFIDDSKEVLDWGEKSHYTGEIVSLVVDKLSLLDGYSIDARSVREYLFLTKRYGDYSKDHTWFNILIDQRDQILDEEWREIQEYITRKVLDGEDRIDPMPSEKDFWFDPYFRLIRIVPKESRKGLVSFYRDTNTYLFLETDITVELLEKLRSLMHKIIGDALIRIPEGTPVVNDKGIRQLFITLRDPEKLQYIELIEPESLRYGIETIINFIEECNIVCLPLLLELWLNNPENKRKKIVADLFDGIRSGKIVVNLDDPLHAEANYAVIKSQLVKSNVKRQLTFDEFKEFANKVKEKFLEAEVAEYGVTEAIKKQVRGVIYEGDLLRNKLLEVEKRANDLGLSVVVVENLSLGAVVTSPITEERTGIKYIVGTDIRVISTKIGSTESHHNEYVLNMRLFSQRDKEFIRKERPIVVVVDASTSVGDRSRTSPHIPDAYKGYRNYFMAEEKATRGPLRAKDWFVEDDFIKELNSKRAFKQLVSELRTMKIESEKDVGPYKMYFWYPGNKHLYVRKSKEKSAVAPKIADTDNINSSALIFIQSAIEPEALPDKARDYIGGRHVSAFFDDKDHFKDFYLDYEEGRGIVLSRKLINYARYEYRRYLDFIGVPEESVFGPIAQDEGDIRDIDTIILDLDGTVAKTNKPVSPVMLDLLLRLLAKKRIVIMTEDIEDNLAVRLINRIPADLRHNLTIFSDGGTKGFTFTKKGKKKYLTDYNKKSKLSSRAKKQVLKLIETYFSGEYEIDRREKKISPEYRIDLRNIRVNRDEFINKMRDSIESEEITAKIYKVGKTSVKIVLQHKEDAFRYYLEKYSIL
ncbi:hypothetical protein ACFLQ8_03780, partial [Candidatus Auribacterota bacterium]